MNNKKNGRKLLFLFFLFLSIALPSMGILASKPNIAISKNGEIVYSTIDTGATTKITWTTVGFTIRREKTNGNPMKDKEYATVWLKESYKESIPLGNGDVKIIFTIPEKDVNRALDKAGFDEIAQDDIIYLNGIFQVKHGGTLLSKKHYTFSSISSAEVWGDPNDFWDRFDVEVTYQSLPQKVEIRYITSKKAEIEKILLDKDQWVKAGKKVSVNLDEKKIYKLDKQEYELVKSYYRYFSDDKKGMREIVERNESNIEKVKKRTAKMAVGGIQFVAVMAKKDTEGPEQPPEEVIGEDLTEPELQGVIRAETRSYEEFQVEDGIPTTEDLYVNVLATPYLIGYRWLRINGEKSYPVTIQKTYELNWTTEDTGMDGTTIVTHHSDRETVRRTIQVKKPYTYWIIDNLDYFLIEKAAVQNYALPTEKVILCPEEYEYPALSYKKESPGNHLKAPVYTDPIVLPSDDISGSGSRPDIPDDDFESEAGNRIKEWLVHNDSVVFDGKVIMSDQVSVKEGKRPERIPQPVGLIGPDVLYQTALTIEKNKKNGENDSEGSLWYRHQIEVETEYPDTSLEYEIPDINPVLIHTPVVCDAKIEDLKKYNQMLAPDQSLAPLVLDTSFAILLPTVGEHRDILGYGSRDYDKYTGKRQVKFPFDVYLEEQYIKQGTWAEIEDTSTSCYLPIWVDEGTYSIEFRSISINCEENKGMGDTEELANLDEQNYVAVDQIVVEVSGRIYDLQLFDISDYPLWQEVFRNPESLSLTGFHYTVGEKNQNGKPNGWKDSFPLVKGSHPKFKNIGTVKPGYTTRFVVTTIGNMDGEEDGINIEPTFTFVNKQGGERQDVDIYYRKQREESGTYQTELIRIGSQKDNENQHLIRLSDVYLGVDKTELQTTASLMAIPYTEFLKRNANAFSYGLIQIPEEARTFVGYKHWFSLQNALPSAVSKEKVYRSMQKWYFEYYLPASLYILPKGFPLASYSKENPINGREDFWLKEGYVICNYNIETIRKGRGHLSYINEINAQKGYCNMWKTEGFAYQKQDYKGNRFSFVDGDVILYETDTSAAKDYRSSGTH